MLMLEPTNREALPIPAASQVRLVRINAAFLAELLLLPEGTIIESAHSDAGTRHELGGEDLIVRLRHCTFDPVGPGTDVPFAYPKYQKMDGQAQFVSWD